MKDTITQQLDEKDMECANILKMTGFGFCAAKMVVALISGEKTQHELTGCTGENQSAVSIALRNLVNEGYVSVSEPIHAEEKGRPKRVYTLTSWEDIVNAIERKTAKEITDMQTEINKLKELTN